MKQVLLIMLLMLSPAIAIKTNADSYNKGDLITINVNNLSPLNHYKLICLSDYDEVFSHEFTAINDSYTYIYNISLIDPSGDWKLIFNNETKIITINQTRDSTHYLISFISPVNKDYERTESFNLRVNITSAGESISNATVQSFTPDGRRVNLTWIRESVYSTPYELGVNESIGIKTIKVMAGKEGYGGEGVINITIIPARIDLSIIQPELGSYDIGSKLIIKLLATYPNSSIPQIGVNASYGSKQINLKLTKGYYTGEYTLTSEDNGLKTLAINASDSFGNTGFISKKITGRGLLIYYLISNIYYIISGLIGAGVVFYYSRRKVVKSLDLNSLKKKEAQLLRKKKGLQADYYIKQSISRSIFDDEVSKVDEQLNIIKLKLRNLKK